MAGIVQEGGKPEAVPKTMAEKRREAVALYTAGITSVAAIGAKLGESEKMAGRLLREGLAERGREHPQGREALVALECDRLDAMLSAVWDKATTGDAKAVEFALKISERRVKLLGLEQPAKGDHAPRQEVTPLTDEQCREFRERFALLAKNCRDCPHAGG